MRKQWKPDPFLLSLSGLGTRLALTIIHGCGRAVKSVDDLISFITSVTSGGCREAGPVVVSAGPEGCSSSSRLGSNTPRLVETQTICTTSLVAYLRLDHPPPPPPPPLDIKHVMNNTRPFPFFSSVYYCQRKPKNRKNGIGLGTRLYVHVDHTDCLRHAAEMAVVEPIWQLHTLIVMNSW